MNELTKLLTSKELCSCLKISRATMYKLIEKKCFPVIKIGGDLRFKQKDIEQYINKSQV